MDYKEIIKMLRKKNIDWEKVEEVTCQAFEALKSSDPRTYANLMDWLETLAYSIDKEHAEEIVRNMRPKGQMWTCDQVKQFVESKGIKENYVDWYLVMNMCYNDYYSTAKIYGLQNDVEFYYNLAKDFIEDPDAEPHKVARYFCG